jgi:hypothetical protein
MDALALSLVLMLVGAYALYWVIRMGVRHGVMDADRRTPR